MASCTYWHTRHRFGHCRRRIFHRRHYQQCHHHNVWPEKAVGCPIKSAVPVLIQEWRSFWSILLNGKYKISGQCPAYYVSLQQISTGINGGLGQNKTPRHHLKQSWPTYTHRKAKIFLKEQIQTCPDNKVHGANMGPIWGREDPGGPHVGPMNLVIRVLQCLLNHKSALLLWCSCNVCVYLYRTPTDVIPEVKTFSILPVGYQSL